MAVQKSSIVRLAAEKSHLMDDLLNEEPIPSDAAAADETRTIVAAAAFRALDDLFCRAARIMV